MQDKTRLNLRTKWKFFSSFPPALPVAISRKCFQKFLQKLKTDNSRVDQISILIVEVVITISSSGKCCRGTISLFSRRAFRAIALKKFKS